MHTSARWLRAALSCALLALVTAFPAPPAYAGTSCVTTAATPSCTFVCFAGDIIAVEVGGPGAVQGGGTCGGGSAWCAGDVHCVDPGTDPADSGDTGYCDLTQGAWAFCSAGGGVPDPTEPCDIADFLCTLVQRVEDLLGDGAGSLVCPVLQSLAPGLPGVVDVTEQGDVYLLGEPFWDCPPYGS